MSIEGGAPDVDHGELMRVDTRGRINVGKFTTAGTNYLIDKQEDGTIVLRPAVVLTITEWEALVHKENVQADSRPATPCGEVCQDSHAGKTHVEAYPEGAHDSEKGSVSDADEFSSAGATVA